jgi:hypothetical protein
MQTEAAPHVPQRTCISSKLASEKYSVSLSKTQTRSTTFSNGFSTKPQQSLMGESRKLENIIKAEDHDSTTKAQDHIKVRRLEDLGFTVANKNKSNNKMQQDVCPEITKEGRNVEDLGFTVTSHDKSDNKMQYNMSVDSMNVGGKRKEMDDVTNDDELNDTKRYEMPVRCSSIDDKRTYTAEAQNDDSAASENNMGTLQREYGNTSTARQGHEGDKTQTQTQTHRKNDVMIGSTADTLLGKIQRLVMEGRKAESESVEVVKDALLGRHRVTAESKAQLRFFCVFVMSVCAHACICMNVRGCLWVLMLW